MTSVSPRSIPLTLKIPENQPSKSARNTAWGLLIACGVMIVFIALGSNPSKETPVYQGEYWHGNSTGSVLAGRSLNTLSD